MVIVRCSQKLLKRLHVKPAAEEPSPSDNPLGEWCADIEFLDREPFVVLMNAATGAVILLPGRAADLKKLHTRAAQQLALLFDACGINNRIALAELDAWQMPPAFTRNSNRSLVASMNLRKYESWLQLASGTTAFDVALHTLEVPFSRKDLGRGYHFAANLLRKYLLPPATVTQLLPARDSN